MNMLGLSLLLMSGLLLQLPVYAAGPFILMPIADTRPYGWLDEQGQAQGLLPDIAAALAVQAELEIKVDIVPYARAVHMLEARKADASLLFSPPRENSKAANTHLEQVMVVFLNRQVVQMRPGLRVSSRADLAGLTIGRKRGGCQELVDDRTVNSRFSEYVSHESGLKMLLMGRIDGLCTAEEALDDALESTGLRVVLGTDKAQRFMLGLRPVWLVLSPQFPGPLRQRLVAGIKQLQKNGNIERIFRTRLGESYVVDLPK
jgi:polar amino acid transport system substrate-binding protein